MTVWTEQGHQASWAATNRNLGNIYSMRIKGDKSDNLKKSLEFYARAMTVEPEFPYQFSNGVQSLGVIFRKGEFYLLV